MSELQYFEYEDKVEDQRISVLAFEGGVIFTVEDDWAGDSEAGFGQSCSVRVPEDKVSELVAILQKWASSR